MNLRYSVFISGVNVPAVISRLLEWVYKTLGASPLPH